MQTDVEILEAARRIVAAATLTEKPRGLPPGYHGPIDLSYIRAAPQEFPKMVYKASTKNPNGYITRTVLSKAEQDTLPKGWLTTPAEVRGLLDPIIAAKNAPPDEEHEEEEVKGKSQTIRK
jgi:hypothetical protein